MKIQKTGGESHREITSPKGNAEKRDRFSKILEAKRREPSPHFNLLTENENFGLSEATRQPEIVASITPSLDIERLATEIVDHISSRQMNGPRSVEIQFNSKTLEGLRVSVHSEGGLVAIGFVAPSTRVAGLVQKELGALRSALESKGVRIAQLVLSRQAG